MILLAAAAPVAFAADTFDFDVPQQPANTALTSFAQQAGISVLFQFDAVSGLTANRLVGKHTVADGVKILLDGLGLKANLRAGQLTVRVAKKRASSKPPPGSRKPAPQASGGDQAGLEQIIVTARFRQENLQEIPLAVSAFTAEMLAANGATSVLDVARFAPNVTLDALGQGFGPTVAANVRGLGYGDFKATSEPTVTFYIDDVVLARPTGAIMDLLDLERVEVLRGPQGTLFGKNAIGGVVRMISRKPGEGDGGGNMELTLGSYNRFDVRGSFESTLIDDKLFSRVAFVSKTRDGYMNNVDFRCAMIRAGTPQLAGVGDGIVGWDRVNNVPIMGVPFSAADNNFAVPTKVSDRGSDGDCVVGRLGDQNTKAARVMLRYMPSDVFEMNFSADITDEHDTSPYELTNRIATGSAIPALMRNWNAQVALPTYGVPYDQRFQAPDNHTTYAGFNAAAPDGGIVTPNASNLRHWGTSVTLDFNLDAVQIKLILARRKFDALFGQDSDGSPLAYSALTNDIVDHQDTVELRLSGKLFGGRTAWTAGYFGLDSLDFNPSTVSLAPCTLATSCIDRLDYVWVDNSGLFINTETDLTKKLGLSVGLRNSHDHKDILQERYDRAGSFCCGFQNPKIVTADYSRTDPMVSLTYALADRVHLYATYQSGFRGGGTSARATGTTRVPFGPETLQNREIGIKSDLFGNRVRINASFFDMVYKHIQQNAVGLDELGQIANVMTNAGEASIKGYEVETRVSVGKHWTVANSLARLDYQLTDLGNASAEALARAGLNTANAPNINDGPNRAPPYTASVNVGYSLNLPSSAKLSVRLGAAWRDATWWGVDGDESNPDNRVPANTLTNFRVAWASPRDQWEAALFCTNCANVRTTSGIFDTLTLIGRSSVTYVRPAEWGVSVKRTF